MTLKGEKAVPLDKHRSPAVRLERMKKHRDRVIRERNQLQDENVILREVRVAAERLVRDWEDDELVDEAFDNLCAVLARSRPEPHQDEGGGSQRQDEDQGEGPPLR